MHAPNPEKPLRVPCPRCRELTEYTPTNPWRPFCSERCQKIDMGAWASEEFRIAATPPTPGQDEETPE